MDTLLLNAILSAVLNMALLAGVPFLGYFLYQKFRKKRGFSEIRQRAGLQLGNTRYIAYSLVISLIAVTFLLLWPPSLDAHIQEGSAQRQFVGLGLSMQVVMMSLLYGIFKTGFTEELLFRGLIAGSLARRLPLVWANILQAAIFLLPHLLLLTFMPAAEVAWLLPLIFAGALLAGWLRIKSGSIIGPWIIHASLNITMGLIVAVRTAIQG